MRRKKLCVIVLIGFLLVSCGEGGDGGTVSQPTGQPTQLTAKLDGAQVVPPVTTEGSGSATITVNSAQTEIAVTLTVSGLTGITASHIHAGDPGVSGGIIFWLSGDAFTSPLSVTLTAGPGSFIAAGGINTFAEAVTAIINGNTYVNVHTQVNPLGEIRGQIKP